MGWRKLTVRDGDLARCCAAQGPIICEASLEVCFDAAASSLAVRQWTTAADWADSLSPRQSGPRMWSSTLQRSVRLRCRTALSKLRGMTSRPVSGRPTRQGLCMSIDTTIVVLPFQPKFERLRYSASQLRNDQRAARSP